MSSHAYRFRVRQAPVERPPSVTFVAAAGVLAALGLATLVLVAIWLRLQSGMPLLAQAVDLALAVFVPLLLIWLYWGVWELVSSSWWTHMVFGPVLVIGLAALLMGLPAGLPLLAHDLKEEHVAMLALGLRAVVLCLIGVEVATIVALLGARRAFGIGVKKEPWERARRF